MKLLLDCDAVFERLTRGPFPGDSPSPNDGEVEAHLRVCHECRQLAEALRPAVALLHEAYVESPGEVQPLPTYHGATALGPQLSARSLSVGSGGRGDGGRLGHWSLAWQLIAACLIGVVAGGYVVSGWLQQQRAQPLALRSNLTGGNGFTALAALKLQEVCLPSSMALAQNNGARLHCCTECHAATKGKAAAGPPKSAGIDVARLQLACMACHEPPQ